MPNGKPGDHPYTDIVTHGYDRHTDQFAALVRDIDDYGDVGAISLAQELVAGLYGVDADDDPARIEAEVAALSDEIEKAPTYRADSPLEACLADVAAVYDAERRRLVRAIEAGIDDAVDYPFGVRNELAGTLWSAGWGPADLDALEADLRAFAAGHEISLE